MKIRLKLIICSIILLLTLFGFLFIYANFKIIGYTEYTVDYYVGDYIGLNLDEGAIHFGTIQPGNSHRRELIVNSDRDILVKILPYGLEHLIIENNNIMVLSGKQEKISILIRLPLSAEEGFYSGKLKVVYLRS